ncbi:hypothetical protein SUGI_0716740 [Cryptomeria japonica]|nr:hypothetical protein SUGI_0716740 [Cryptomeria japonica]
MIPSMEWRCRCNCLVCKFYLLLLLILSIAIAIAILYAAFQPEIPDYSVKNIQIMGSSHGSCATISSEFPVDATARNLKKKIAINFCDGFD